MCWLLTLQYRRIHTERIERHREDQIYQIEAHWRRNIWRLEIRLGVWLASIAIETNMGIRCQMCCAAMCSILILTSTRNMESSRWIRIYSHAPLSIAARIISMPVLPCNEVHDWVSRPNSLQPRTGDAVLSCAPFQFTHAQVHALTVDLSLFFSAIEPGVLAYCSDHGQASGKYWSRVERLSSVEPHRMTADSAVTGSRGCL